MSAAPKFPFTSNSIIYVMANVTDSYKLERLSERRSVLLNGGSAKNSALHITLMELHININHDSSSMFSDEKFQAAIATAYINTIQASKLKLTSELGCYDLIGASEKKFYVKDYKPDDEKVITKFRTEIYNIITFLVGSYDIKPEIKEISGKKFHVFSYQGKELFAVPDYYRGTGNWKPHISLASTDDLEKNNTNLFRTFSSKTSKEDKMSVLFQPIWNAKFQPIGPIHMDTHVSEIVVSISGKSQSFHV